VKDLWFADEAVVVVKRFAKEGMATYWRIKQSVRDMEVKGEGRNMLEVVKAIINWHIVVSRMELVGNIRIDIEANADQSICCK
jgi:hypothetical protein